MGLLRHLLPLALLVFMAVPAIAADLTVTNVINADTVLLSDGRTIRLYGIQAPQPTWPLADKAKKHLESIALDKHVTVHDAQSATNRLGQRLAEVTLVNGESLQVAMLRAGMARVYTTAENPTIATALYPIEQKARTAKLGIWSLPTYTVLTPETAGENMDRFQIIQGKVLSTTIVSGIVYLNFGEDWHHDFTVMMGADIAKAIGAVELKGHTIRARGWIYSKSGPMLSISHAEQIEVVE